MLKKIAVSCCILLSYASCGQANKTLKDPVFQKGDIVLFPAFIFALSLPCCWDEQLDSIKPVAKFLKHHPELKAEVAVHMSYLGSAEMNNRLSDFRARRVRETLVNYFGVDSSALSYKGYGESKLLMSEAQIKKAKTPEEQQKLHNINTRTELIITEVKAP